MKDHRVRLDDRELALVVAALKARAPGLKRLDTRQATLRLAERLAECSPGNPYLVFGWTDADLVDEPPATPQRQEEASR